MGLPSVVEVIFILVAVVVAVALLAPLVVFAFLYDRRQRARIRGSDPTPPARRRE